MKICYLADARSIHTKRWVSYFAERGHEVHLISKTIDYCLPNNVKLHLLKRLPESALTLPVNTFFTILQIKNIIRKIKPDIIHAFYILDYGFYGSLMGFHPLVETVLGSDVLLSKSKLVKYALEKADVITYNGENARQAIISMGIDRKKIKLISHGVDTNKFNPNKRIAGLIPTVISARSLTPIYDVSTFIRAIPMVLEKVPNVKFIVMGDGPEKDILIKMAERSGILENVDFVGAMPHNHMPERLASSDVYVSTSLSDSGIAISTLEAMASGVAIISTDVGDIRSWIEDGVNGFIIPTKDHVALAQKIIYLLQNKKEFGIMNRCAVQENADYYKEMEKVEKIYEALK